MSHRQSFTHVTLTHPKPYIWVIELHNGQDSRLTEDLILQGVLPALDAVEREWLQYRSSTKSDKNDKFAGAGAVIIVGNRQQDKFFSNGLDFEKAIKNRDFFPAVFNPMLNRLMTFPLPTIAAINGHCFAGGFMLSLACDFRVMTDGKRRNAWLCMNEVHFGAVWPASFAAILRAKFGQGRLQRMIALEGHKFTPEEALKEGIIDYIVASSVTPSTASTTVVEAGKATADVLAKAEEVATMVAINAKSGVWGLIKADIYRDAVEVCKEGSSAHLRQASKL